MFSSESQYDSVRGGFFRHLVQPSALFFRDFFIYAHANSYVSRNFQSQYSCNDADMSDSSSDLVSHKTKLATDVSSHLRKDAGSPNPSIATAGARRICRMKNISRRVDLRRLPLVLILPAMQSIYVCYVHASSIQNTLPL